MDVMCKTQVVEEAKERERLSKQSGEITGEGIHKESNHQRPSSHCSVFNHWRPALDLSICCYDGNRDRVNDNANNKTRSQKSAFHHTKHVRV